MNDFVNCANNKARGVFEKKCFISKSSAFRGFVAVGDFSYVGERCWITNTLIGRFSWIENGVEIGYKKVFKNAVSNHSFALSEGNFLFDDPSYSKLTTDRFFNHKQPLVHIGNDVRVCKGSIVLAGVSLSDGVLVLPNSVVYDDAKPYEVLAGNPARVIGKRFQDDIIEKLVKTDWVNKDFSNFNLGRRKNYLDVSNFITEVENASLDFKKVSFNYFDPILQVNEGSVSKVAIQGPSHISKWIGHIQKKELQISDNLMYGEPGLSISSTSFRNFENWWLRNSENNLVFFVPDFRIGNSNEIEGSDGCDGVFIYENVISNEIDSVLYEKAINILDGLVNKFGRRIKFIFWCLYGREKTNIKNNKYTKNGFYSHPTWNYQDLISRYKNNSIDIEAFAEDIFKYIDLDGSIHPNLEGFKLLENEIGQIEW